MGKKKQRDKNKKSNKVYAIGLVAIFITIFYWHSTTRVRDYWRWYDSIIAANFHSVVVKTGATSSGSHLHLSNSESYIFSSRYNYEYQCWGSKCARPGDTAVKRTGDDYFYVIKKDGVDTIRIDIHKPGHSRPK